MVDMKTRNLLAVAAIVLLAACETPYRATDVSGTVEVSSTTQQAFLDQYPNATNVVWSSYDPSVVILNDWELAEFPTLESTDYAVAFDLDNEKYYAWYDRSGSWIGSAYVVRDFTTMPSAVHSTISSQFPSYTITSVNREFKRDRVCYEVVLKKDDSKVVLLVDNNGNILKQKSKTTY
jgi:hypothetical protein